MNDTDNIPFQPDEWADATVFGFDIGSKSIGLCVRDGQDIEFMGSLIVDANDDDELLDDRRQKRMSRRNRRYKRQRLEFLIETLQELGGEKFQLMEDRGPADPRRYRYEGLTGNSWDSKPAIEKGNLSPIQLTHALYHLARRRGRYPTVPWSRGENEDDQENDYREQSVALLKDAEHSYPIEYMKELYPDEPTREILWNTNRVVAEARDLLKVHQGKYSFLSDDNIEYILFGEYDERAGEYDIPVHKGDPHPDEPGLFSLKWPRFDNRNPGLDAEQPFDEDGEPNHVCKKDCHTYRVYHREERLFALRNDWGFEDPDGNWITMDEHPELVTALSDYLRKRWTINPDHPDTKQDLQNYLGKDFDSSLVKPSETPAETGQGYRAEQLTNYRIPTEFDGIQPDTDGRSQFSRPTLESRIEQFKNNERPQHQPVVKPHCFDHDEAVHELIHSINDPIVKHRLKLIDRVLQEVLNEYEVPDAVTVELPRTFHEPDQSDSFNRFSSKDKEVSDYTPVDTLTPDQPVWGDHEENDIDWSDTEDYWDLDPRQRNGLINEIYDELYGTDNPSRQARRKLKLLMDQRFNCPYCGDPLSPSDLKHGVAIDHIIPRKRFYNDTNNNRVASCEECNRNKDKRTPKQWKGSETFPRDWDAYVNDVSTMFGPDASDGNQVKFNILTEDEDNPVDHLDYRRPGIRTGYINRYVRYLTLLRMDEHDENGKWLTEDGHDPVEDPNSQGHRYFPTSGYLTSRLRHFWDINELANELYSDLDNPREAYQRDVRNHAVDAAVIAGTLPHYHYRGIDNERFDGAFFRDDNDDPQMDNPAGMDKETIQSYMNESSIRILPYRKTSQKGPIHDDTNYGVVTIEVDDEKEQRLASKKPLLNKDGKGNGFTYNELGDPTEVAPHSLGLYLQKVMEKHYGRDDLSKNINQTVIQETSYKEYQSWKDKKHHLDTKKLEKMGEPRIKLASEYDDPEELTPIQSIKKVKDVGPESHVADCIDEANGCYRRYVNNRTEYSIVYNEKQDNYSIVAQFSDGTPERPLNEHESIVQTFNKGAVIYFDDSFKNGFGEFGPYAMKGKSKNELRLLPLHLFGYSNDLEGFTDYLSENYWFNGDGEIKRGAYDLFDAITKINEPQIEDFIP